MGKDKWKGKLIHLIWHCTQYCIHYKRPVKEAGSSTNWPPDVPLMSRCDVFKLGYIVSWRNSFILTLKFEYSYILTLKFEYFAVPRYIRTELFILMILLQCKKWPRLASLLSISNHNYRYMYWQWNLYIFKYIPGTIKKKNNIKIFKTYPYLQISMTEPRHHS